ncbi:hypothetical protein B0A48_02065 [Cryoendolithus antarcticus]|uniref:DUF7923 domain-containing protein n=1 Tax=Cryoendolithus antarcticus TaxID=1507870 RepID=A0A1V8TMJ7_9PEZI|nr:hypothetical protein B0A48_02065 [Cryoendolithus antarcticus]
MLQERQDRKPFVSVLLDGDNTLFCDRYVQAGVAGGSEAAAALRDVIKTQLLQAKRFKQDWDICIRAYMNADGLARTYRRCGIVAGEDTFRDFVRGFNKAMSLVELIDAGDDKEAADTRIQKTFEIFYPNQHCKQLVLAVSGDRSYTGFLRPYVSLEGFEDRVSFVEALPFTRDMVDLTTSILKFRAPTLLRKDKLVVTTQPSDSAASQSAPSTGTYATAVALQRQTMPAASPVTAGAATLQAYGNTTQAFLPLRTSHSITRNAHGERIDEPVPSDSVLRETFMSLPTRLCFEYYLKTCTRASCNKNHEVRMSELGRTTLLSMARNIKCSKKDCIDPTCYHGHRGTTA